MIISNRLNIDKTSRKTKGADMTNRAFFAVL